TACFRRCWRRRGVLVVPLPSVPLPSVPLPSVPLPAVPLPSAPAASASACSLPAASLRPVMAAFPTVRPRFAAVPSKRGSIVCPLRYGARRAAPVPPRTQPTRTSACPRGIRLLRERREPRGPHSALPALPGPVTDADRDAGRRAHRLPY